LILRSDGIGRVDPQVCVGGPVGTQARLASPPFTDAYQQSVPVAIPAFHRLEPQISLDYAAGIGNGLVRNGSVSPSCTTGKHTRRRSKQNEEVHDATRCAPFSSYEIQFDAHGTL